MDRRTLWIVSGSAEACPGISRAKAMGLHVVVSDGSPNAPGFEFADDRVIASTYDVDATLRATLDYHRNVRAVDGVMCMAADVPLTVASVAAELGLPGIPVSAAQMASDKLLMKQRFQSVGVATPWFAAVPTVNDLKRTVKDRGFPLVVKPIDSRGARGVVRMTESVDIDWAYKHSREHSPTSRVMVEEYLAGPQISTESVLWDGVAATPGFIDRNYEFLERFAPYMIENGGQQPSSLGDKCREDVANLAVRAGRALGVTQGIVKGDMVLTEAGPKVIEVATRLSGGWMSSDQVPLATGVDLVGIAIQLALGRPVSGQDLIPISHEGVAIRYFFPSPGRVLAIRNADRFNNEPWVHRMGFFVEPGDVIGPVTNHTKRAGFVIAKGRTSDEAVERAATVAREIVFDMESL